MKVYGEIALGVLAYVVIIAVVHFAFELLIQIRVWPVSLVNLALDQMLTDFAKSVLKVFISVPLFLKIQAVANSQKFSFWQYIALNTRGFRLSYSQELQLERMSAKFVISNIVIFSFIFNLCLFFVELVTIFARSWAFLSEPLMRPLSGDLQLFFSLQYISEILRVHLPAWFASLDRPDSVHAALRHGSSREDAWTVLALLLASSILAFRAGVYLLLRCRLLRSRIFLLAAVAFALNNVGGILTSAQLYQPAVRNSERQLRAEFGNSTYSVLERRLREGNGAALLSYNTQRQDIRINIFSDEREMSLFIESLDRSQERPFFDMQWYALPDLSADVPAHGYSFRSSIDSSVPPFALIYISHFSNVYHHLNPNSPRTASFLQIVKLSIIVFSSSLVVPFAWSPLLLPVILVSLGFGRKISSSILLDSALSTLPSDRAAKWRSAIMSAAAAHVRKVSGKPGSPNPPQL